MANVTALRAIDHDGEVIHVVITRPDLARRSHLKRLDASPLQNVSRIARSRRRSGPRVRRRRIGRVGIGSRRGEQQIVVEAGADEGVRHDVLRVPGGYSDSPSLRISPTDSVEVEPIDWDLDVGYIDGRRPL